VESSKDGLKSEREDGERHEERKRGRMDECMGA
jgi:hypothetical protein